MIKKVLSIIHRRLIPKRAKCFPLCEKLLSNGVGLEIGGPSGVFTRKDILPIYPVLKRLDNCNFTNKTIWEGTITEGMTFQYDKKRAPGRQYISEGSALQAIPSATYDFILSSHVIEHIANPLQALSEWVRVLKEEGYLILLVPHKDGTFDHKRPVTPLNHLIEDFKQGIEEEDLTHLSEILELHDLERDSAAGNFESFKTRSEKNLENRCLHHHVFDTTLVVQLLEHMKFQIHAVENVSPYHIIAIAQKMPINKGPLK
jgi:SAM-dependent methyltransferase